MNTLHWKRTPIRSSAAAGRAGFALALSAALQVSAGAGAALAEEEAIEEVVVVADGSQVELFPAYEGGQIARGGRAGILGNLDMMDTFFTSTNYTAKLMLDQQAEGVGDVLQNDPVVRVARGFGNFQELYVIRGFAAYSDDMTYNGIYGILPRQFVAAEFLERVELFRGANSFLNGAAPGGSNVGGAVNLVPKRAPEQPLTRSTIGFEESGHGYAALDVARRFGPERSHGVRVNVAGRDGETAVEDQDRDLTVVAFGYDYSHERFRLSADIGYQDHAIDAPRPSVTPTGGVPEPPSASSNFAQPWTVTEEEQLFGVVRGEFDVSDSTMVWAAFGSRGGEEMNVLANPQSNAAGETSLIRFDNFREDSVYSGEVGVRSQFDTGAVGHRLILSASQFSLESKNAYAFSSFARFPNDLYDPFPVPPPPATAFTGGEFDDPLVTQETNTSSVALADMLSFLDERLMVTLGLRHQNIETESFDYNTGASTAHYDEGRVTPIGAVVLRFGEEVSVYGNYAEGLVPGETAPAASGGSPVDNAGEAFEPYQSEQYEIGVKYDSGKWGGSLAAFEMTRPSAFVENNLFSVSGEQRNRGLELSVFGQPHETVTVLGGATWLDAEMTQSQGGQFDGEEAVGAPDVQVNVNLEWDVPAIANLTVDGRIIYTSSQWADPANTVKVPSWSRLDVGLRYATAIAERQVVFRARLDNVTNSDDWVSVGGEGTNNYLVLGMPRTFSITASVEL